MGGWVYIITNKKFGVLYIGVTSDLPRRIYEHRNGLCDGFTKRYKLTMLVWYAHYDEIYDAIQCEKTMKHWVRAWKINKIEQMNPGWNDLYEALV